MKIVTKISAAIVLGASLASSPATFAKPYGYCAIGDVHQTRYYSGFFDFAKTDWTKFKSKFKDYAIKKYDSNLISQHIYCDNKDSINKSKASQKNDMKQDKEQQTKAVKTRWKL